MSAAQRQRRRSQRKRAARMAAYAASPPVTVWMGLEIVKLDALLSSSQHPEKPPIS